MHESQIGNVMPGVMHLHHPSSGNLLRSQCGKHPPEVTPGWMTYLVSTANCMDCLTELMVHSDLQRTLATVRLHELRKCTNQESKTE